MNEPLRPDVSRLQAEIDELAAISEWPAPAVTRVLFSEADLRARDWFAAKCRELDLELRTDPVGNVFARWVGSAPDLPAIATGSHIDAIPNAGRYDGVVGVLGALEAFRTLKAAGFQPGRSLEIIVFTAEEPTRFGLGCLGSRLLSGAIEPAAALKLEDKDGLSLTDWLARMPWRAGSLEEVRLSTSAYRAFTELHIEQGPVLEREHLDIGIVNKIAAPSSFRFIITGSGGHAGAVLMPDRNDAFCGACEVGLLIEKAARETGSPDTVATTGGVHVEPNAINSIPFRVKMEVDLRDTQVETRGRALERIRTGAEAICRERGLQLQFESINLDPPANGAPELVESLLHHAREAGYRARTMVSRAYHDSLFMALLCPTTMIFIPCRKGYSHRPDEYSSPEQMRAGVELLARTLQDWSVSL